VAPAFDRLPDWSTARASLEAALSGRLDIDSALEEREERYARFRRSVSAYPAEPRVLIDNDASAVATVIEVRAPDRGPVLYRVAHALSVSGVYITRALINTLGAEAIDVFYVQSTEGGRVTDPAHLLSISETVLAAL
jgi:[protein-PII] uridylyltransferase